MYGKFSPLGSNTVQYSTVSSQVQAQPFRYYFCTLLYDDWLWHARPMIKEEKKKSSHYDSADVKMDHLYALRPATYKVPSHRLNVGWLLLYDTTADGAEED